MSPERPRGVTAELEVGAIRFATQFTVGAATGIVTVTQLTALASGSTHTNTVQTTTMLLAAMLWVSSLVFRRSHYVNWLALASLLLNVLAVVIGPDVAARHAQASNWIFGLLYIGIILLPRRAALAWGLASIGLWMYLVPVAALPATVAGHSLNARWFSAVQLAVSGVWLWRVWYREIEQARRRDLAALRAELNLLEAERQQERVRVWRQMLVRTHETVLNDLRYLLDAPTIDRGRLAQQVTDREYQLQSGHPRRHSVGAIVTSIADRERLTDVLTLDGDEVLLTEGQSSLLHPLVLEAVRNALRHTESRTIRVSAERGAGHVSVSVHHDATTAAHDGERGIGTSVVLEETLASVGGRLKTRADGLEMIVPDQYPLDSGEQSVPFDAGRGTLTAITAGNAAGGLAFSIMLLLADDLHDVLLGIIGLVVSCVGVSVAVRRGRVPNTTHLLVAALATLAPVLVAIDTGDCRRLDIGITVAVLTGFGLVATVMWTPSMRWWWIASGWAAGMVLVAVRIPTPCTGNAGSALTAAVAPILLFVAIYWSLRSAARRTSTLQRLLREDARASAAASAAIDVSAQLNESVGEATALMADIAAGREVDEVTRLRLRCLDSDIRSGLQVDPVTAGGVARAARLLATEASADGRPARVLALRDSGNSDPLDARVIGGARVLLAAATDGSAVIQAVAHSDEEVLLITTSAEAALRSGLDPEWSQPFTDGSAELTIDDGVAVLMVRRAIRSSDEGVGAR